MSLYDSSGTRLGMLTDVFQGEQQTFTCMVQDTRPGVTIDWYLDDVFQSTIDPPTGERQGFTNTSGSWTFTPTREHNGQVVMCVASTAESQRPFPFVSVTLRVNGMYNFHNI